MRTDFPYDVFLSHNAKDKPRVRKLAERLRDAGLRVWFDEWIVKPGDIIALKVDEGLDQSRVLLLCISPNALTSNWVALERSTAVHRDPENGGRRFVPLLLADCDLPDTLRRYKYVDFRKETASALNEIIAASRFERSGAAAAGRHDPLVPGEDPPTKPPNLKKPMAVLERKLIGHTDWVKSIVVSPDGKWATSGSSDKMIKIWDLESGECRATLEGHSEGVNSVTITPTGREVISCSNDTTIRVWDVTSGNLNASWKGHGGYFVFAVFALPDGRHVLSGANEGELGLWNIESGQRARELAPLSAPVRSVAAGGLTKRGVAGMQDGTIGVLDLETGECLAVLSGHSRKVNSVKITADERFAVSGSEDRTIKIWDLDFRDCVGTLEGHHESVYSIAISSSDGLVASAGWLDKTVRLWDLNSGACLQVITDEWSGFIPISVAFSPDGSRLLVGFGHSYGQIYVYHIARAIIKSLVDAPRRYANAKVVLIGEGTVGKTSLAHRLIEDKYVIQDRTHGMNVWRMDLPLSPDATLEREALLWDLAGQEDYRLIHQLFLEETALALLLANPQKDDPFAEAGDWLKALKTAAGSGSAREAVRLLIFSQTDVGGMKLGDAKIKRFCEQYGFGNWIPTSAKTGENCSDAENGGHPSALKRLIAESIPWDKLPWTSTPRMLTELKNAVMSMRDTSDIRLLRFSELAQRLEQALPGEKFGESDVRTAVTLLGNHGLARPLKFGDLVLLQPELLNGYAGAIIRAARAHTDEIGSVLEADVYKIDFDFTGVERLKHRPDEELLLRALVQTFLDHSLCIAEDTPQGRHLVFPSQYRREKDIPKDPDIFVSYTFSGEWQTVWTTLIVRLWYSHEFEHRELWRNAAEFASGKGHTLGLKIDNKQGEGTATISLYFDQEVPDELKSIFIEYVHRHLARYGCEVSRDRRYICPNPKCGKPVKDLDEVRERLAAGKTFIYCQKCDKKVPLIDFIEQRLKTSPVAARVVAMDAAATRELDTQALEQILIGHMMAICGEANQIFRPTTMFDHGIDGEVEFKNDDGKASGQKIYIQLKSGNSYLRTRKKDGREVFDVRNDRHLDYWVSQPVDVFLVIRQKDELTGQEMIRWMNVSKYLKDRKDKKSRQIVFDGEKLDMEAVWKVRDRFFPPKG